MDSDIGRRVRVWDGAYEKCLGEGVFQGNQPVSIFRMPDGSLKSFFDAERQPTEKEIAFFVGQGAQHETLPGNPKILLDTGDTVYGCQVWWGFIDEPDATEDK